MGIDKANSAAGMSNDSWSHSNPAADVSKLQPALITTNSIVLEKISKSSSDLIATMASDGAHVRTYAASLYRSGTYLGTNRALNGADLIKGKKVLYESPAHAIQICSALHSVVKDISTLAADAKTPTDVIVGSMEMQDAEKLTMQQWKPVGWHLTKPYADWFRKSGPNRSLLPYIDKVLDKYCSVIPELLSKTDSWYWKYSEEDWDPADTMTGLWTAAAGEKTFEARSLMLSSLASPLTSTPRKWIEHYDALGASLGLDPGMIYSAMVATRSGPLKKPVTLWVKDMVGYTAAFSAVGAYNRVRFVFPSAYPVNFILSAVYKMLATARQRILGLWHDPVSQANYVKVMSEVKGQAYTIDFSGMDTSMAPSVIQYISEALLRRGFPVWIMKTWIQLYDQMGIFLPSYSGRSDEVEWMNGAVRPWGSGFKLTSEYDTIYGAACLLASLDDQIPGLSDRWVDDKWVFAELGDDIIFSLKEKLDPTRLAEFALSQWGAKIEILDDSLFLKTFLPIDGRISKVSKPYSRFLQQTFWNEDSYDGIEGGDRPDSVMRLALFARGDRVTSHPWFKQLWPKIAPIVGELKFTRSASSSWRNDLMAGKLRLDDGDAADIQAYAQRVPEFMKKLIARAQYEPSAYSLLITLQELGLGKEEMITEKQQRSILLKQLLGEADRSAFEKSLAFTPFR